MSKQTPPTAEAESPLSTFAAVSGSILAVSYPVLALSTGVRASYQLLFKDGVDNYLPPALSALAALFYLVATVGFTYRKKWAWHLSVWSLGLETLLTLLIGGLSYAYPDAIGSTVWRHFGADYGYFPLIQPLIGLAWLFRRETLVAYHVRPAQKA